MLVEETSESQEGMHFIFDSLEILSSVQSDHTLARDGGLNSLFIMTCLYL